MTQLLTREDDGASDLLSPAEVGALLGVSKKTVLRRIGAGGLPAARQPIPNGVGYRYAVQWGDVLAWVERGEQ